MPSALRPYADLIGDVWERLRSAADDRAHPMHLMTLATVDIDGRPDARLMVLRGASPETRTLWFHTDGRSAKVEQVTANREVTVVCYDATDEIQLRLQGHAVLHVDDEVARRHWEQIDLAVRTAYGQSPPPGAPMPSPDPRMRLHQSQQATHTENAGLHYFTVLEVNLNVIQWLQVGPHGDRRAIARRADHWRVQPLAPLHVCSTRHTLHVSQLTRQAVAD